jgi:hypothetical protein
MKTASAKAKGRNLQKYVRDTIYKYFPSLQAGDVESRSMGASGTDILLSPTARRLFPFAIEAKNQEKVNIWAAWKQACENSEEFLDPILVIKRNREKPLIIMDFETFVEIMSL